jgi:hypothetical protein
MQKFTSEDLLLYALGETEPDISALIEAAIQQNLDIKNEVLALKQSIDDISHFHLSPNKKCIDTVLHSLQETDKVHIV